MNQLRIGLLMAVLMATAWGCTGCNDRQSSAGMITPSSQYESVKSTTVVSTVPARESRIPDGAEKIFPETDQYPPIIYSDDYEPAIPIPGQVNTAGAEDSVFVLPDGNTLFFFFTPDVKVPPEKQILDEVTGLYVSQKIEGNWSLPERIVLQESGKLALDGCVFVQGQTMWFCSTREGYSGIHWFRAVNQNGIWQNVNKVDFNPEFQVGELHISQNQSLLYYHSMREGGAGGLDIWMSEAENGEWLAPMNVSSLNSADDEGWPVLNSTEDELWITRNWGLWRSSKLDGEWQQPELIVSPFAGEASLDNAGNLYFIHHFYKDGKMIEADIYVAYRRK